MSHLIRDLAALEAIYGEPSRGAVMKEIDYLHPHYRTFVDAAPFAALATSGPGGLDVTPRGDPAGFVTVQDERTLLLPDRNGNNRVDSLRNVVADPRVALLFLIPGIEETLRINGHADISVDPELLSRLAVNGKLPRSVLVIHIERVYFQCARAILRSKLWDPTIRISRQSLPSTGTIMADITRDHENYGATYDRDAPARLVAGMY